jgi:hypothetical protein
MPSYLSHDITRPMIIRVCNRVQPNENIASIVVKKDRQTPLAKPLIFGKQAVRRGDRPACGTSFQGAKSHGGRTRAPIDSLFNLSSQFRCKLNIFQKRRGNFIYTLGPVPAAPGWCEVIGCHESSIQADTWNWSISSQTVTSFAS